MPNLNNTNHTCYLCGSQAFFISFNSKKPRCVEKITQCPGFIKKAEATRKKRYSSEERRAHMKAMSEKGNAVLKERHTDDEWLSKKSNKISESLSSRGGHHGLNNPMFGRKHSNEAKKKMSGSAAKRNPKCYEAATATKIKKGIATPKELKTEWELYREQVHNFTRKSWQAHQNEINPLGLIRGSKYELDHKYSITEGFRQGVDPKIIGSSANLEIVPKLVNRSKRTACSITLDNLIKANTQ